jgi:hypothetical protein
MFQLVQVGGAVPDCVTENVFPAIVALAERDEESAFCVHETVVDPGALPLDGETVSHEPLPDALQFPPWHPAGPDPLMFTGCDPGAALGLAEGGVIVNEVHAGGATEAVVKVSPVPTTDHPEEFLAHPRN